MVESNRGLKVAVGGMTCVNCEVLVERRFKDVPGVASVRVDHRQGFVEIAETAPVEIAALQRAVEEDGYTVAPWDAAARRPKHTPRDYAEIAGVFLVIIGAVFALQHLGLMPHGFALSDSMTLGLVFVIGLVASVSSCMAVTGGLLIAVSAAYNEGTTGLTGFQRLKPHLYFNAGRLVSYTLLGGVIGAIGSALTLSEGTNGLLTIAASAIMILLGLQMLGFLPRVGRFLLPKSLAHRVHNLASRKVAGGTFTLGALSFFLPCGFTQALQLYVLGKGSFATGAITMLVFALGTLPALLSLSVLSSFATGGFQRHFLRFAGGVVIVLGFLNIQYGLVLSQLGSTKPAVAEADFEVGKPVPATQEAGKQVVTMRVIDFAYQPNVFEVKQGVPVEWRIDASDAAGCGRLLLAPRLGIRKILSDRSTTLIAFTPQEVGEFPFNCGMGMMTPGSKFIVVKG